MAHRDLHGVLAGALEAARAQLPELAAMTEAQVSALAAGLAATVAATTAGPADGAHLAAGPAPGGDGHNAVLGSVDPAGALAGCEPAICANVLDECRRQVGLWGVQHHPDGTGLGLLSDAQAARAACQAAFADGCGTWRHILAEEVAEAFAEDDGIALRAELIQVAAVCVSWVRDVDGRAGAG